MQECTGANVKRSEVSSVHFWRCLTLVISISFFFCDVQREEVECFYGKSLTEWPVKWLAKFSHTQTSRGSFGWNWCSWLTSSQILFSHFHVTVCCGEAITSRQRLLNVFHSTSLYITLIKKKDFRTVGRKGTGVCEELRLKMTPTKL